MLKEEIIKSIKAFIDQPSTENAMKTTHYGLCIMYGILGFEEQPCGECAWNRICQVFNIAPGEVTGKITDKMLSAMVLDAIQVLAMYEAKNE